MKKKTPSQSKTVVTDLVMAQHTNPAGDLFGGILLAWMDKAALITATNYCETKAVTVGIDSVEFKQHASIGDQITIKSIVEYVGRTSMEIGIVVTSINPMRFKGEKEIMRAHFTFVALDEEGRPCEVPRLLLETEEEHAAHNITSHRIHYRKQMKEKIAELKVPKNDKYVLKVI